MKVLFSVLCLGAFTLTGIAQQTIEIDPKRFSENWFDDLEEAKKIPEKVYYLDLTLQKLKQFPEVIFTFPNLQELYASYNYWPEIPEGLSGMEQLEMIDVSGNYYMNALPADLEKMKWLKKLVVKDNKLNAGEVATLRKALPDTEIITD